MTGALVVRSGHALRWSKPSSGHRSPIKSQAFNGKEWDFNYFNMIFGNNIP
jgi:hypothetical protein